MKTALTILAVFFAASAIAADRTTVRDQTGKITGKITGRIYHERNRDYRDTTGKN